MEITVCRLAVYSFLLFNLAAEDSLQPGARARRSHKITKRIVHGQPVYLSPTPYLVSLQVWVGFRWVHLCGGTLVTPSKVLTAAHCVYTTAWSDFRVGLGWLHLHQTHGLEQNIGVSKIVVHSGYIPKEAGFPNDVAIITLAANATINEDVKTVPIASGVIPQPTNTTGCVISGWGHIMGPIDGVLRETTINVISNTDCADMLINVSGASIFDHHICVFETPKASCNGDSGGPLVCDGILFGISSYGVRSCTGDFPSVFGFVPHFYDWIMKHLSD